MKLYTRKNLQGVAFALSCFAGTASAGLIEGTFNATINTLSETGLLDSYQDEYYNGASQFNGEVGVGSVVSGSFSYFTENVAQDISPENNSLGNYDSATNDWLFLSFDIAGQTFDFSQPYYKNTLPEQTNYQEYLIFSNKEGANSFNMLKFNQTETVISEEGQEVGVVDKYNFAQLGLGLFSGELLSGINPNQAFSFVNDSNSRDSYGHMTFITRESYFDLNSGTYDYYKGASVSLTLDSLKLGPVASVPGPSSALFLLPVMFLAMRRISNQ